MAHLSPRRVIVSNNKFSSVDENKRACSESGATILVSGTFAESQEAVLASSRTNEGRVRSRNHIVRCLFDDPVHGLRKFSQYFSCSASATRRTVTTHASEPPLLFLLPIAERRDARQPRRTTYRGLLRSATQSKFRVSFLLALDADHVRARA